VPVAARFARDCPFLLESDQLSLSRDFAVQKNGLADIPMGAVHQVRTPGRALLLALGNTTTYAHVADLAGRQGISDGQLCELLGFLNTIGALERRRTPAGHCRAAGMQCIHLLLGTRYVPMTWRRVPTWPTLVLGTLRATWPVTVATTAVCVLAVGGGLLSLRTGLSIGSGGIGAFIGSLFVHEVMHVVVARRSNTEPHILQLGMRLGIIHQSLQPKAEALSALAGPSAGCIVCIVAAAICSLADLDPVAIVLAAVACFHVGSLLPWYGDGASLYKALRRRRLEPFS